LLVAGWEEAAAGLLAAGLETTDGGGLTVGAAALVVARLTGSGVVVGATVVFRLAGLGNSKESVPVRQDRENQAFGKPDILVNDRATYPGPKLVDAKVFTIQAATMRRVVLNFMVFRKKTLEFAI
jgi:hypothetical protein